VHGRELLPNWCHYLDRLPRRLLLPCGISRHLRLPNWDLLVGVGRRLHQLPWGAVPKYCEPIELQGVSHWVLLPRWFSLLHRVPLRVLLPVWIVDVLIVPDRHLLH